MSPIRINATLISLSNDYEYLVVDYFGADNNAGLLVPASEVIDFDVTNHNLSSKNISLDYIDRLYPDNIKLVTYRYGLADNSILSVDVTETINVWCENDFCLTAQNFNPNDVFGDPYPGQNKHIFITYILNNVIKKIKVNESDFPVTLIDKSLITKNIWKNVSQDNLYDFFDKCNSIDVDSFSHILNLITFKQEFINAAIDIIDSNSLKADNIIFLNVILDDKWLEHVKDHHNINRDDYINDIISKYCDQVREIKDISMIYIIGYGIPDIFINKISKITSCRIFNIHSDVKSMNLNISGQTIYEMVDYIIIKDIVSNCKNSKLIYMTSKHLNCSMSDLINASVKFNDVYKIQDMTHALESKVSFEANPIITIID